MTLRGRTLDPVEIERPERPGNFIEMSKYRYLRRVSKARDPRGFVRSTRIISAIGLFTDFAALIGRQ